MSIIITNGCDCAEKELLNNWAAEYSKRAIEDHKTAETIDHPDGSVTTDKIKNGAVSTDKVADKSITTEKIASGAVTTDILAGTSITTDKISNAAVTEAKLGNSSVTTDKVKDGAITENKLADYSVTTNRIAQGAVNNNIIANGAVDTRTIADFAVTAAKIADGAVTADKLSMYSVKTDNIAPEAVTSDKLRQRSVTAEKIADGTITSDKLNADLSAQLFNNLYVSVSDLINTDTLEAAGVTGGLFLLDNTMMDYDCKREIKRSNGDKILLMSDTNFVNTPLKGGCVYLCYPNGMFMPSDESKFYDAICIISEFDVAGKKCVYDDTKPARVGTWIDGKPIWRVGFNITEALTPGELFSFNIPVKSSSDVAIINSFAMLRHDADVCDYIDDRQLNQDAGNTWVLPDNLYDATGVYGYIEFATPETNIKGA